MSLLYTPLVLTLLLEAATISVHRIPLARDSEGYLRLTISLSIGGVTPFEHRTPRLYFNDRCIFGRDSSTPSETANSIIQIVTSNSSTIPSYTTSPAFVWRDTISSSLLAIGQNSGLLERFNSVSIVRMTEEENETAEMILDSSLENFAESCFPDSIMASPVDTLDRLLISFQMGTETIASEVLVGLGSEAFNFLKLPESILTIILRILETSVPPLCRLEQSTREMILLAPCARFDTLTNVSLASLPTVGIQIGNRSIALYPDEYLSNYYSGAYRLRIGRSPEDMMWVSPLAFRGLNVRLSSAFAHFCESRL
jgi:hypothetical protein